MRRFSLVMIPFVLAVALPFGCFGCEASKPTEPTPPERAIDVHWGVLCRDHQTAASYAGQKIKVRLEAKEFDVAATNAGWDIQVWAGDRAVPPILVFHCDEQIPNLPIIVMGRCSTPVRDGIWRSPRADYYVAVTDCRILRR